MHVYACRPEAGPFYSCGCSFYAWFLLSVRFLVLFVIITLNCNVGEGMMNQKDRDGRSKVAHIIEITDDYKLVVDDQKNVDEPLHVLWWEHKEDEDKTIEVVLNRYTEELTLGSIKKIERAYLESGKDSK